MSEETAIRLPPCVATLRDLRDELKEKLEDATERAEQLYQQAADVGAERDAIELRIRCLEDTLYCFSVARPKRKLVGDCH